MHTDDDNPLSAYTRSSEPHFVTAAQQHYPQQRQRQTAMGEGRVITRMRPSLTCIPCKRKKIKCDKQKPVCSQCGRSSATCFYETISAPASESGRSWGAGVKRARNGQSHAMVAQANGNVFQSQQDMDSDAQRGSRESTQGPTNHQLAGGEEMAMDMDMMMHWQSETANESHSEHRVLVGMHSDFGNMEAEMSNFLDETCPLFSAADLKEMENFYHTVHSPEFLREAAPCSAASAAAAVTTVPTPPATAGSSGSSTGPTVFNSSHLVPSLSSFPAPAESSTNTQKETRSVNKASVSVANPLSPRQQQQQQQQHYQRHQSHQEEQRQQRASSTASMDTLDFDDKAARPRRYIPHENERTLATPAGNLLINNAPGHHVRFLGSPFWAWTSTSQKSLGNILLSSHLSQHQASQMHHCRQAELSRMMQSLPPKKMCDILLDSFLLGVQPLLPMVHVPSLRSRYDAFWSQFSRNRHTRSSSTPPMPDIMPALKEDPSFASLLWAVLYCGAVAAPPNLLARASFKVSDRWTFLSRLRSYVNQALHLSGQAKFPTLDGLVASILAQWCDPGVDQIIDMPPFIAQCVQAARVLGLHKDEALAAMSVTDAQTGRMVWQHVMELEILATVCSGACLAFLSSDESFDMPPPLKVTDIALDPLLTSSSSRILATGRLEMIRIMRRIIKVCYYTSGSSKGSDNATSYPTKDDIKNLSQEIECFENIMDALIGLLNVRGQPEQGQISSLLLGANPLIHGELYTDNPRDITVPNAFYRIILTMMKFFVSVLFNRQFLQQRNLSNEQQNNDEGDDNVRMIWNLQLSNCVQLIRNYLDLSRLPAFVPYRWLCPGKVDCFQECMIVLNFLKEYPEAMSERQLLQYLLSEVFDMFDSRVQMAGMGSGTGSSTDDEYDSEQRKRQSGKTASWLVLRQLFDEVFNESQNGRDEPVGAAEDEDDDMESEDDAPMEDDDDESDHATFQLGQHRTSYPPPPTPMNSIILSPQPQHPRRLDQSFNTVDRPPPQQERRSRASTSTSASGTSNPDRDRRTQSNYPDVGQLRRGVSFQGEYPARRLRPQQSQDPRYPDHERSYPASNRPYSTGLASDGFEFNNTTFTTPNGWIKQHPTRLSSPTNANMTARAEGFGIQPITASSSSSSLRSAGKNSGKESGLPHSLPWSLARPSTGINSSAVDEMPDEWLDILS
ncbi:hypothetical protein V8F06_010596 [Rhypophila decipiens]